jgi:hypothetical protein
MRLKLCLTAAALLVAFPPVPATAQRTSADADTREVLAYRLTMPKLKQLNDALADVKHRRESDPAQQELNRKKKELEALSAKDELTQAEQVRIEQLEREIADAEDAADSQDDADQSLSQMAARMAADSHIAAALKKAGLAPREAATLQLAFVQAALTAGLLETGTIKEIPAGVSADNVKFCQAHKAEIAALSMLNSQDEDGRTP